MQINPHIVVQGAHRAAAFYRDAFGAEELTRIPTPDGRIMSLQLRFGESVLHMPTSFPRWACWRRPRLVGQPSF